MQDRISRKKTKRPRKKAKSRGGYQQTPNPGFSFKSNIHPIRAKLIPNELSVALVNTDYDAFGPGASFVSRKFGIVEFLAYRPLYCLELYQIYKYARITAVDIEVRVCNQSLTGPIVVALGMCPNSDYAGLTPDRAWETPGTVRRFLSVQGGMDRGTVKKTFVGQDAYGQPYLDQKYWIDVSQSSSTTPVDTNEPIAYYMLSDSTGVSRLQCTVEFKITYHIQFFDLRIPSSSLEARPSEQSFEEAEVETQMEQFKLKPAKVLKKK